jgi:hypothetical protein
MEKAVVASSWRLCKGSEKNHEQTLDLPEDLYGTSDNLYGKRSKQKSRKVYA